MNHIVPLVRRLPICKTFISQKRSIHTNRWMVSVFLKFMCLLTFRGHCGSTWEFLTTQFTVWEVEWLGWFCLLDGWFFSPCFPFTDVLELIALTTVNSRSPYRFSQCMCFPNCIEKYFLSFKISKKANKKRWGQICFSVSDITNKQKKWKCVFFSNGEDVEL